MIKKVDSVSGADMPLKERGRASSRWGASNDSGPVHA
jgi:hypothetical protein